MRILETNLQKEKRTNQATTGTYCPIWEKDHKTSILWKWVPIGMRIVKDTKIFNWMKNQVLFFNYAVMEESLSLSLSHSLGCFKTVIFFVCNVKL